MILRLVFSFIIFYNSIECFDVNYFDDSVLFQITTNKRNELDNRLGDDPKMASIVSADDENYFCMLPEITERKKNLITDYTGPTPTELLSAMYSEQTCSQLNDVYWRYELCHGKYLRQFHDDKDSKITAEFYLGSYPKDKNEATPAFDFSKPPIKGIEDKLVPYFPVNYIHGTHCDLNGQPRRTTIIYICSTDLVRKFLSITEVKTCVYEAVVAVKELCTHPSFQREQPVEHEIRCFAAEDVENPVPKSMLRFQNDVKARPMLPLKSSQGPLTQRVPSQYITKDVYELFRNPDTLKQIKELKNLINAVRKPKPSATEDNLMKAFWSGKACLYGGGGYWRFEFCYNRQVSQFHEESNGKSTRINLGHFNLKMHKEWAAGSEISPRVYENDRVTQVSVMYTGGDICHETKSLRKCEVRMKCRSPSDTEPNAINMFLIEPETCSYVLLIESALLCDKIQEADELGLLPEQIGEETAKEEDYSYGDIKA